MGTLCRARGVGGRAGVEGRVVVCRGEGLGVVGGGSMDRLSDLGGVSCPMAEELEGLLEGDSDVVVLREGDVEGELDEKRSNFGEGAEAVLRNGWVREGLVMVRPRASAMVAPALLDKRSWEGPRHFLR